MVISNSNAEASLSSPYGLIFDVEPINTGKYCLNGDTTKCYFEVYDNNTLQYIGDQEQTEELYSLALNPQGYTVATIQEDWLEPKEYVLYRFEHFPNNKMLAWEVTHDDRGEITGGEGSFLDKENTIHYCGCDFMYIES